MYLFIYLFIFIQVYLCDFRFLTCEDRLIIVIIIAVRWYSEEGDVHYNGKEIYGPVCSQAVLNLPSRKGALDDDRTLGTEKVM